MARYTARENAMVTIYMHLVQKLPMDVIIEDVDFITQVSDFLPLTILDDEMKEVCRTVELRQEIYGAALQQFLNHWRFDRLGFIEQSIFLLACAELEIGEQPKTVIVSEAVRLAKTYADEESYKLINGVLDAL